jgi:hypothetical protein
LLSLLRPSSRSVPPGVASRPNSVDGHASSNILYDGRPDLIANPWYCTTGLDVDSAGWVMIADVVVLIAVVHQGTVLVAPARSTALDLPRTHEPSPGRASEETAPRDGRVRSTEPNQWRR